MDPNNAAFEHQLKVERLRVKYWKGLWSSQNVLEDKACHQGLRDAREARAELEQMGEEL